MAEHPCPFTAGDLLALAAIADTRARQPGTTAARLADMCAEHAKQHPITETQEDKT